MRFRLAAITFAFCLAATATAHAGAYLGAGLGVSDYNQSLWSIEDRGNETGWTVFGGYQFNRYLALETGWLDLGTVNERYASIETTGLSIAGIASLPVGPVFSIFASLGLFAWDQHVRSSGIDDSRSGTDPAWAYGFAARFLDQRLGLRLGWNRYDSDNDADFIAVDVSYHY